MVENWANKAVGKKLTSDMIPDPQVDPDLLEKEVVVLVQAKNFFGDDVYSYVQLTFRNLNQMMKKMVTNESFLPSEYGTVIAAGRGEPPQHVRDEMQNTYNLMDVLQPSGAQSHTPSAMESAIKNAPKVAASMQAKVSGAQPSGKPVMSNPKFFDDDQE